MRINNVQLTNNKNKIQEERKADMEARKAKIKEICKTDKTKCEAIKELRKKHKAEMDTLIN